MEDDDALCMQYSINSGSFQASVGRVPELQRRRHTPHLHQQPLHLPPQPWRPSLPRRRRVKAVETRSPWVCSRQSRTRRLPSSSSPLTTRRRSGASRNFPRYATAGGSYSPCSTESTRLMLGDKKDLSKNILGNMKRGLGRTRFWSGGKPWKLLVEELVGFSRTGNATKLHKHSETLDY